LYPEDGGDIFLRKITVSPNYMVLKLIKNHTNFMTLVRRLVLGCSQKYYFDKLQMNAREQNMDFRTEIKKAAFFLRRHSVLEIFGFERYI
jgi:hypothetical protein